MHGFESFRWLSNIQPLSPQSEPFKINFFSALHRFLWENPDSTTIHMIQKNEYNNTGHNLLSLYGKYVDFCEINLEAPLKIIIVSVNASFWLWGKWSWVTGLKSHVLVPLTSFETLKLKMKLKYSLNSFVKLSREEAVVWVFFFSI